MYEKKASPATRRTNDKREMKKGPHHIREAGDGGKGRRRAAGKNLKKKTVN